VLQQAVLTSPIFGTRWRWDAGRSLALLRFSQGRKVPANIQRLRSDDLLASVFPDAAACQENIDGDIKIPDHPLIREVMKDVLTEALDLDGLKGVLTSIADGRIATVAVDTPVPSPFCHELLNANPFAYLDDAPLEERRARAVELRRVLPASVVEEVGKLDQAAIQQVTEDARPDVRDADELHDALLTLVAMPAAHVGRTDLRAGVYEPFFAELVRDRRASQVVIGDRTYWVATERAETFSSLADSADSVLKLVRGWMQHSGPVTAAELAGRVPVSVEDVDQALLRLESEGAVLRGKFRSSMSSMVEWCDRRLLARIHQLTLGRLRREIEPVTAAVFMRWLCEWQRIAPGAQAAGERGLLGVLQQLQGFEAPASAWEPQILARRVSQYDPAWLDTLCLAGAVGWGRLSPHPATLEPVTAEGPARRVIPTSVAPITFFVRAEADWMTPHGDRGDVAGLTRQGHAVHAHLRRAGASFFPDIVRGTKLLKAEVETALWELVAAGLVTADGFDNLRALIDPRRRAGHGSGKLTRPRHSTGRWALLFGGEAADRTAAIEATCWMLLRRYGVVFRELLARETILPPWREVLIAFRRLEDRGEIRGGRFVSSFIGEQFALPEAVESLRAMRRAPATGATITVSAADPLNLVGIVVPGERVPAVSGRTVSFRDGVAVEAAPTFSADAIRRIG
jgi:ATP-dependent Lhr-like helicase